MSFIVDSRGYSRGSTTRIFARIGVFRVLLRVVDLRVDLRLNMQITLPSKPKIIKQEDNRAVFEIEGCYPGYGITLGNALRRVLLSSLSGAAITGVKIKGIQHEFSTIDGVLESVLDIILNLKMVRVKLYSDEPVKIFLKARGEKEVKAKDIQTTSDVEIISKDAHIATLTNKKAGLEMEIEVSPGLGYEAIDSKKKEGLEIGQIAIDAVYSPVLRVDFEIEDMRVGERTDYNRLIIEIETDGSISSTDALKKASQILVDHFKTIVAIEGEKKDKEKKTKGRGGEKEKKGADLLKTKLEDLKLSRRTISSLGEGGIKTVSGLVRKKAEDIKELKGLGEKGVGEIKKALKKLGLGLKD